MDSSNKAPMLMSEKTAFDRLLEEQLKNPEFAKAYYEARAQIDAWAQTKSLEDLFKETAEIRQQEEELFKK